MAFFNIKLLGFKKGGKGIYGFVEEKGGAIAGIKPGTFG